MFTTKTIWCTFTSTSSSITTICSSSPSPSPVRLSPVCCTARLRDANLPKKTASKSLPSTSRSTADTSRSTCPSSTSQPRPTVMLSMSMGKSRTPPFSMAKATFCCFGADGMKARIVRQRSGKMSMKCCPCCASASRTFAFHREVAPSPLDRQTTAKVSTEAFDVLIPTLAISQLSDSSKMWKLPFCTSFNFPPEYAATRKTSKETFDGSFFPLIHTISWMPSRLPASSPECVMLPLAAFKLL
mmetsp:Transcript_34689/g.79474  ORF Transcript_34689/g.79474 Transcript_34689/m.79474 type:complete len:243 (+) Transcript_34689:457-1185(+)